MGRRVLYLEGALIAKEIKRSLWLHDFITILFHRIQFESQSSDKTATFLDIQHKHIKTFTIKYSLFVIWFLWVYHISFGSWLRDVWGVITESRQFYVVIGVVARGAFEHFFRGNVRVVTVQTC